MTTHKVETATAAEEATVFAVLTLAFGILADPATHPSGPPGMSHWRADARLLGGRLKGGHGECLDGHSLFHL